jgi:hypothetical protein
MYCSDRATGMFDNSMDWQTAYDTIGVEKDHPTESRHGLCRVEIRGKWYRALLGTSRDEINICSKC